MPKAQWEVGARDRFIHFLNERDAGSYVTTGENVTTNPLSRRDFDFQLTPETQDSPVIALEIFRIVGDELELAQHLTWNDITIRLKAEMARLCVNGYVISTPHFIVPKSKRPQFAREIAELLAAAIANHPDEQEFATDGYTFFKLPGCPQVEFSHIGQVRQIDPVASVNDVLDELLPTKNEQLDTQGRLRVLLILNAGVFPHGEEEVRQYFSTKDLQEYPNIDRVFFEIAPGTISLIFDRRIFDSYRESRIPPDDGDPELAGLFLKFLEHRLSFRDAKAFGIVQGVYQRYGDLNRLSSVGKDALISCGEAFAQDGDWPSVLWIIDRLKSDPDPTFPSPMHNHVLEGEDYRLIVSVRGRLCWLIRIVIAHNLIEHYSSMLDIIEGYACGRDFYIRSQACVPLAEIALRRRQRLPNGERFMPDEMADRVKRIAMRMLEDAGTNPALLDEVSKVLGWIGDLTEDQASQVIRRLSGVTSIDGVHNRCRLLLYFSLFLEKHFADLPPFDPARFKQQLHEEIKDGECRFRTSLMWQIAGRAEDAPIPYEIVEPYLSAFVAGPFCDGGFFNMRRIFEVHGESHSERLCSIMLSGLAGLVTHIAENPGARGWKVYDLLECLKVLADNCSEECVLDAAALAVKYEAVPPGLRASLAYILRGYASERATKLRDQLQ
jgi:hypothetical protein